MAITFLQRKRLQQWLLLGFVGVLLVIIFVLWLGFKRKSAPPALEETFIPKREVKINLEVLENPLIEELEPVEEIEEFEGEVGRENPFLPY